MDFVGILVRRRDKLAAAVEDECRPGASDLELREEMRKARVFDDDRKDALTFLVNIDRSRIGDRWTLPDRMVDNLEPLRLLGGQASLEPSLVADVKASRLEAAVLKLDVARDHLILIDAALTGMVGQ